jgi:acetylornithine deacetylase
VSEVIELLGRLIAIDSVNPGLVSGAPGEGEIARFVASWMQRAGLDVKVSEVAPGRPNVIGTVRGSGGRRSLMLNAHMDTVGHGEMVDPLVPRVEGNRMHGRGSYDMKG